MSELPYIRSALKSKAKLRWLVRALKLSRFQDMHGLYQRVEEKIERAVKRKGELTQDDICLIFENVLWAKLFRRLQVWKLKSFSPTNPTQPINGHDQASFCTIFKEHHYRMKTNPAILLPGFVPEGNEAFYLLRHSFLKYGSAYYINFPRDHYKDEVVFNSFMI